MHKDMRSADKGKGVQVKNTMETALRRRGAVVNEQDTGRRLDAQCISQ